MKNIDHRFTKFVGLVLAFLFWMPHANAQTPASGTTPVAAPYDLKANYTKYEYRIPMRDGKHLFTVAYVPKEAGKTYPFLMQRTPYACGPYGVDRYGKVAPTDDFMKAGYIFVCQDVRGRYMSEGEFIEMTPHKVVKKSNADVDQSTDMFDTVQWLLGHVPGNNGKVGIWGISYPGFYTSASIIDSHPAIKAASPQAPIADMYMGDDSYHGGAFMLPHNFGFFTFFKSQDKPTTGPKGYIPFDYGTSDGYDYFLNLGNLSNIANALGKPGNPMFDVMLEHERYDEFWKSRNIAPHL